MRNSSQRLKKSKKTLKSIQNKELIIKNKVDNDNLFNNDTNKLINSWSGICKNKSRWVFTQYEFTWILHVNEKTYILPIYTTKSNKKFKLRNLGLSVEELLEKGIPEYIICNYYCSGFTPLDFYRANIPLSDVCCQPYSRQSIINAGYNRKDVLNEIYEKSKIFEKVPDEYFGDLNPTATELKEYFDIKRLCKMGITALELYKFGFSKDELYEAGCDVIYGKRADFIYFFHESDQLENNHPSNYLFNELIVMDICSYI